MLCGAAGKAEISRIGAASGPRISRAPAWARPAWRSIGYFVFGIRPSVTLSLADQRGGYQRQQQGGVGKPAQSVIQARLRHRRPASL
jgi:hypothetical protein